MIASELDFIVPSISMSDINEFLEITKKEYQDSVFYKEEIVYRERNNRDYPWTRRFLEFKGAKLFEYQNYLKSIYDLIELLPVSPGTRTVSLICQEQQKNYDFNFHFDGEKQHRYGYRICIGLNINESFLEFSKLKEEFVQHAREKNKIENHMVESKIYSLAPTRSNTVFCVNSTDYPHRVPLHGSGSRIVFIISGDVKDITSHKYLQIIEE